MNPFSTRSNDHDDRYGCSGCAKCKPKAPAPSSQQTFLTDLALPITTGLLILCSAGEGCEIAFDELHARERPALAAIAKLSPEAQIAVVDDKRADLLCSFDETALVAGLPYPEGRRRARRVELPPPADPDQARRESLLARFGRGNCIVWPIFRPAPQ